MEEEGMSKARTLRTLLEEPIGDLRQELPQKGSKRAKRGAGGVSLSS